MPRLISFLPLVLVPVFAQAHEGHGIDAASHYHATDALGFAVAAALVAMAFSFGKK